MNNVNFLNRYLAEFKTGAERKEAAENTLTAYKAAQVRILISICINLNLLFDQLFDC